MKPRLLATAALGAAILLGATGCAFITPQSTEIQYSASDGVNVPNSGPLKVRNALIITDAEGAAGSMIAAIVNETSDPQVLNLEIGDGADAQKATVRVPANSSVSLGNPDSDTPALVIDSVPVAPGANLPVYFQSGDGEGVLYDIPVLDGALPYYGDLLPTVTPTPTTSTSPTPSPSPSS
ncbi:DNA modification methylase [Microbacterium sp. NPDC091313]